MIRFNIIVLVLALVFPLVFSPVVLAQGKEDYQDPEVLAQLIERQDKDYHLIDTRTDREYRSGYIPTAINIPHDVIGDNLPTEDRSALIIVYCRSGARSGRAKRTLEGLGFTNVINFGGIGSWKGKIEKPE